MKQKQQNFRFTVFPVRQKSHPLHRCNAVNSILIINY